MIFEIHKSLHFLSSACYIPPLKCLVMGFQIPNRGRHDMSWKLQYLYKKWSKFDSLSAIHKYARGEHERQKRFTSQIQCYRNLKLLHTFRRGERWSEQVERNKFTSREIPLLLVLLPVYSWVVPSIERTNCTFPFLQGYRDILNQFSSVAVY